MKQRVLPICLLLLLCTVPVRSQSDDTNALIAAVENSLVPLVRLPDDPETANIADRMAFHNVPGVSIAVIDDGQVAWTRTWGVKDTASGDPVTPETVFQVASISKPVSASGILMLVDSGAISLDADVNEYLTSWAILPSALTDRQPVTMRQLLSHMSGTSVHGFTGYAAGSELPTLIQILNGEPPANSPAVTIEAVPGRGFRYSGGGYEVAQLVAEDVTGEPFAVYMDDHVLRPIGLRHSSYRTPRGEDIALGHMYDGTPVEGGWHVYPEDAAASLWSTPTDIALWALEIRRAYEGGSTLLSQDIAREMLERTGPSQGLGPALQDAPGDVAFLHAGANLGYRAFVLLLRDRGDGVAVLTNGEGGDALWKEILASVAHVYDWPGWYESRDERMLAVLDDFERYAGTYRGPFEVTITVGSGRLLVRIPESLGGHTTPFFPTSSSRFFDVYGRLSDMNFESDEGGHVVGFTTFVPGMGMLAFTKSGS